MRLKSQVVNMAIMCVLSLLSTEYMYNRARATCIGFM